MKTLLNRVVIMMLFVLAIACTDDSLDPIRTKEIQKGSILALRGDGDSEANFFFKDNIQSTDAFSYEAEFLSADQDLLSEVKVYARILTKPRVLVATVPGSVFVVPAGGKSRIGIVTVPLSNILTALGAPTSLKPDTLKRTDIIIESDILLTNGSEVPASAIVNNGLFQSSIFFPAQVLGYRAELQEDFVPTPTTKMAGEVVTNAAGKVTARPVFPLKAGAKDTLYITYDQKINNTPSISISPVGAIILEGSLVKVDAAKDADDDKTFYQLVTAGATYSGAVTVTISGAKSTNYGVELTQAAKKQTINVDNTTPQVAATSTGKRIGKSQIVTISTTFNEKMSAKSADRIKITITGQNLEDVTGATMNLSASGLVASYTYVFKLASANTPATHGPLTITFTGGADESGNSIPAGDLDAAIAATPLICDVGAPPAPTLTLDAGGHDLGVQIKWVAAQGVGTNTGGSTTGTVYFVAVTANDPTPTGFSVDTDGNATWTVGGDEVVQPFSNGVAVSGGTSGTVFTPFTKNGTFDIYAVFVGDTGNRSSITGIPQLEDVVMN